jgi:hypothetical protein
MTDLDTYIEKGDKKIEKMKQKLLTAKQDGVNVEVRKKLRCTISAHANRMKKRMEIDVLNSIVKRLEERASILCENILTKRLKDHPSVVE